MFKLVHLNFSAGILRLPGFLFTKGQYAQYHQVDSGYYHEYTQPGRPIAGLSYVHPDENIDNYIHYWNEEQKEPPAGLTGYLAHKIKIGDGNPG